MLAAFSSFMSCAQLHWLTEVTVVFSKMSNQHDATARWGGIVHKSQVAVDM